MEYLFHGQDKAFNHRDAAMLANWAEATSFGGDDHVTKYSARQRRKAACDEERPPFLSSEPQCLLLRVNATRFSERGPPGQNDGNITSAEWGMSRIKARAA